LFNHRELVIRFERHSFYLVVNRVEEIRYLGFVGFVAFAYVALDVIVEEDEVEEFELGKEVGYCEGTSCCKIGEEVGLLELYVEFVVYGVNDFGENHCDNQIFQ